MPPKPVQKQMTAKKTQADPPQQIKLSEEINPSLAISKPAKITPTLLGIAPELRSRIYTAALIEPHSISLRFHGENQQPSLLLVNRQIRQEGIGIYYIDNTWYLEACKCRGAFWVPFCRLLEKYRSDHRPVLPTIVCTHRDYFDRHNLMAWLKAYHEWKGSPCPAQDTEYQHRNSKNFVIHGILDNMRGKEWKKVKSVVETFVWAAESEEEMRGPMDWEEEQEAMWEEMEMEDEEGGFGDYDDGE